MHTLRIVPISEVIGIFPKEAQAPGIVNQWRRQLESGRNARTGQPLTDRQRRDIQNKIESHESAQAWARATGNAPSLSNPAPAPAPAPQEELPLSGPADPVPENNPTVTTGPGQRGTTNMGETADTGTMGEGAARGTQVTPAPAAPAPAAPAPAPAPAAPVVEEEQPQDMMAQMQELVDQRDQIDQQIQQIQEMFGFEQPQGAPQQAPQQGGFNMPGMNQPQPGQQPAANSGWVDQARNWWNERELGKAQNEQYRQRLQQQRQNLQNPGLAQAARNERPILTASMGSASALMSQ